MALPVDAWLTTVEDLAVKIYMQVCQAALGGLPSDAKTGRGTQPISDGGSRLTSTVAKGPDGPAVPAYDELPCREDKPPRSSWGLWGERDVFGTLNLLTPETVVRAIGEPVSGATFSLNLDLCTPTPEYIGRPSPVHGYAPIGPYGADDVIADYNTQLSTQWDGFGHVRHPVFGHYNGLSRSEHGVGHWASRGICGRGVLADVERWRRHCGNPLSMRTGDSISAADLRATLEWQGTSICQGDILLIRTGWAGWYQALDPAERAHLDRTPCSSPGLAQDEEICRFLWNLHISAAAADNTSFESAPFRQVDQIDQSILANPTKIATYTLMYSLLSLLGIPFGELFALDELADHCVRNGRWSFLFASAPMHLAGGVGSPANALAIV